MKNFRKSSLILFVVVLVFSVSFLFAENHDTTLISSAAAAEIIASGNFGYWDGDDCTYTLDSDGNLVISGTGGMSFEPSVPWGNHVDRIKNVIITDGVTNIGNRAFSNCSNLQSISIPDSVRSIGEDAFYNCSSLQSVTIPDSVTSIGSSAFSSCSSLQSVTIPDSVTSIGSYAFERCSGLKEITIGNGVTRIDSLAFYYCDNIQSVYIKDLTKWLNISFDINSFDVTLSSSPLNKGADLYLNGEKVTDITFPDGTTEISHQIRGCESIRAVTIPDSVTSIEERAFYDCKNLRCLIYTGTSEQWSNITKASYFSSKRIYCLGDGYVLEGKSVFNQSKTMLLYHYSTDKIYTVPTGVKSIEKEAFSDCENLAAVVLPEGLKNIGQYAFLGSNLKSIYIPASVNKIDDYGINFYSLWGTDVYYGGTEEQFKAIDVGESNSFLEKGTIHYNSKIVVVDGAMYTEDMKTLIAISNQNAGSCVIPSTVTKINTCAFSDCDKITEVLIPEFVTVIGAGTFSNCDGIEEIKLPSGITKLNDLTFYDCDKLQSITIPDNVTNIGKNAFNSCDKLKTVNFGSKLLAVGDEAFRDCVEIEKLQFSEKLSSIGNDAFRGCTKLSEVYFPSSLTAIGDNAFKESTALTYISIPDSVNSLGEAVFADCENLEKVCLPAGSLATIPANAFKGCPKLTSMFIPKSITSFGDSAFYGCNELTDIYYGDTEEEWDTITVGTSNSVIWAANVHFSHAHKTTDWETIVEPTEHTEGIKSSVCSECSYEKREAISMKHSSKTVDKVGSTCTKLGYTAGVYCNDCKKYISGHIEIAINASNHVNTKNVPETPATFENVGYTEGVYCNDCKQYISGHVEIPKLENIGDIDGDGQLTASDARFTLRAAVGLDTLSDAQKAAADVDRDGQLTASDARLILRASVGLEDPKNWKK